VLIDEVESFAVSRSAASFEANPWTFTARPTRCCSASTRSPRSSPPCCSSPTTNFIEAVDSAFLSRADLVMRFSLPDVQTIAAILESAIASSRCSGRCSSR
jgi:hypothetical protein